MLVFAGLGESEAKQHKAVGHARRHPETMKMTPHPPSYLGHPLPSGEGGDPAPCAPEPALPCSAPSGGAASGAGAKRESRVRGFFQSKRDGESTDESGTMEG
jgi:hypothetical protein